MTTDTSGARSLEADTERERMLDCRQARPEALQFSPRGHPASPRFALWRHDLRQPHETWFQLVEPNGQDPTPEGS